MSDTPRTDAIVVSGNAERFLSASRMLERELNDAAKEAEHFKSLWIRANDELEEAKKLILSYRITNERDSNENP